MVLKKFTLITHYTFHRLDIPQGDRVVGLGASWPSALYAVVQRRSFSLQSNFVKQKKIIAESLCFTTARNKELYRLLKNGPMGIFELDEWKVP